MKKLEFESAGVKGFVMVPETVQEFDTLAKREGACLDEAINNVLYRGVLADFRDALCVSVESETAIARKTREVEKEKDGKKVTTSVIDESESRYITRAAAEKGGEPTIFQPLADAICTSGWDVSMDDGSTKHYELVFDPSQRERKPRAATIGKGDLEMAQVLLNAGAEKFRIAVQRLEASIGHPIALSGDAEGDKKAVATALKEHRAVLAKQQQNALLA